MSVRSRPQIVAAVLEKLAREMLPPSMVLHWVKVKNTDRVEIMIKTTSNPPLYGCVNTDAEIGWMTPDQLHAWIRVKAGEIEETIKYINAHECNHRCAEYVEQ